MTALTNLLIEGYGLVRKDTSLNAATGFSAHVSSVEGLGQQNVWNQYGRVSQHICSMWFKYVQALLVQTGFQLSTLNCYFLVWQPVLDYRFQVSSLLTILFFSHFPTLDSLDLVWSGNKCSKTKHLVRSTKYPQFFHFPHFPWFPRIFQLPNWSPHGRESPQGAFPRSDGTQRPGPYRRSLAEALRDLTELRRLQRRQGDAAMLRALYALDADAMTAFFVENMENQRDQRAREKNKKNRGQKWWIGDFGWWMLMDAWLGK